jgi:hypothetical protein
MVSRIESDGTYLEDKSMVDELLGDIGVEILTLDESKKELIDDLDMWPGDFQHRLIFLGIKGLSLRVHWRRDRSKEVLAEHIHHPRVHRLGDDLPIVGHVVEQLMQGQSLDLLGLHISTRVIEVEDDITLIDLLHEEVLSSVRRDLVETRELLQLPLR